MEADSCSFSLMAKIMMPEVFVLDFLLKFRKTPCGALELTQVTSGHVSRSRQTVSICLMAVLFSTKNKEHELLRGST